ncbi:MAG: hypothetical protein ACM3PP_04945 [Candidatus Saccharibacteria bacterium]
MVLNKCSYCNKAGAENKITLNTWSGIGKANRDFYYCSETCRQGIESFADFVNKNANLFIMVVTLSVLAMSFMSVFFLYSLLAVGCITIFLGLFIIKYPFATPQTNGWLGIKRAVGLTRILGAVLGVVGILVVLMYFRVF